MLTSAIALLVASHSFAWTIKSRELVDVEISANDSLTILVSAPGADSPGLYQWKTGVAAPVKVCDIVHPAFFSFNRRMVIERVRGETNRLRLYDATSCALTGQIDVQGRVIDADARESMVAIAVHYPDEERALELYTLQGKRIATTPIGKNVELGFAPDGKSILNFDLSDAAHAKWRVRSLEQVASPRWMNTGELTFIPGAQYVKRYAQGALSIVQWSTGKPKYVTAALRTVRVRQLSRDGQYGVIHERLPLGDRVAWFDFATGIRVPLGEGSIDHAAINAKGTRVAWSVRSGVAADEVTLSRATLNANGIVTEEN